MAKEDATKFKTPKELGITPEEHKWLLKASLQLCEAGDNRVMQVNGQNHYFHMGIWCRKGTYAQRYDHTCGTAGCLQGTTLLMAKAAGEPIPEWHPLGGCGYSFPLMPLFTPGYYPGGGLAGEKISPQRAAKAALHFLKTGEYKFNF